MTAKEECEGTGSTLFARGVSVHFEGVTALEDVDLALAPGEILGLIGPNGAGKTTLVNVLTGFQRPDTGTVGIDGVEMTGRPAHDFARAGLGRTFQAVRLFAGMTVLDNVELGAVGKGIARAEARAEARQILDWLGLGAMAETVSGTLPYGDERWVGLARALAGRPRFLLLDEPAAGLNEAEAERLVATVARIRDRFGCGVLIIEHNMQLVMSLCDRIHVLEHGRTIATGTPAEAQADPEVRRAYLGGHGPGSADAEAQDGGGRRRAASFAAGRDLLAVEGLQVNYGPVQALRGVSLSIGEGELVSVIGPNGAGKSTLTLAIAGIVPPAAGRIHYDGADLSGRPAERIVRDGISLVPEGRHVFPALTVEENLIAGATPARGRGNVDPAALEEVLETFPILKERYRSAAGKLSGGEQQQLVIARALLAKPRLLLLDEPSLGLAPLVIDLVFDILARMRDAGQTILLVEQNADRALAISDRTYVLRSGAIVLSGASADLAVDPAFDEAYFGFAQNVPAGAAAPAP